MLNSFEVEIDNELPILGALLGQKDDGILQFSIYRNGTPTENYLNGAPKENKKPANTLIIRAMRICDNEHICNVITN